MNALDGSIKSIISDYKSFLRDLPLTDADRSPGQEKRETIVQKLSLNQPKEYPEFTRGIF